MYHNVETEIVHKIKNKLKKGKKKLKKYKKKKPNKNK